MQKIKNKITLAFAFIFQFISFQVIAEISLEDFKQGFVPFYYDKQQGETLLLIERFEQPFIYQSGLSQGIGSNDIGLDRGQMGETRLVQFEDAGDKVLLRQLNTQYRAISDNPLEAESVKTAFAESVLWGFPVVERTDNVLIVDASDFLLNDIHGIARRLSKADQGNYSVDKSRSAFFTKNSKTFPLNTELEATVTFTGSKPGVYLASVAPDAYSFSVRMHHSFVQLPDDDFEPRVFHPKSGYWPVSYFDYATPIGQSIEKRFIPRHRLKKKNVQAKLTEAIEPIIYYLDSGTPEPVRSALLDGARWWDQAYQAIGYKNAFQVKILPADADPMDLRYNVIQWVHRSTRGWSYGYGITDPRTGEIIKGHVSLGSLRVRQDYLIAQALLSPFSKDKNSKKITEKMQQMALARIRQLSAHEIGHTLGLAHNFAASEDNRSSVMDYPQPLIVLENGELKLDDAYDNKIGSWDKKVIAYGYSDFASAGEQQQLDKVILEMKNAGLQYISGADARAVSSPHPDANLWDNGSDATSELQRMLKIRNFALKNFGENSIPMGEPYSSLEELLVPLYFYHRYQLIAVGKAIGGYYYDYAIRDNEPFNMRTATGTEQWQAVNALVESLQPKVLSVPKHIVSLIPPKAMGYYKTRESSSGRNGIVFDPVSLAESAAAHSLNILFNPKRLSRLQQQTVTDKTIPSVSELFDAMNNKILKAQHEKMNGKIHRRIIYSVIISWQKLYQNKQLSPEVKNDLYKALSDYQKWMENQLWFTLKSSAYYNFYLRESKQIEAFLAFPQTFKLPELMAMPPGSPI